MAFSIESFLDQYETDTSELVIRNRRFRFFVPKSIDRFLDQGDLLRDFPLWSKIWEASIVLSDFLAGMPPDRGKNFLEIGCGMGVVGVVASAFGHRVTATEYNSNALNFVRANACANLSQEDPCPEIVELDWTKPRLEGSFDYIVGSEIAYRDDNFEPIFGLFERYLSPSGEVILAEGLRKTSMEFFRQMSGFFDIKAQKKVLRSKGKESRIVLAMMKKRPQHKKRRW